MFWIDVLLSVTLPFVALGVVSMGLALVMRHGISPSTIERLRAKNPPLDVSHPENRPGHLRVHGWESPLDAEITRLRRKSLGQ